MTAGARLARWVSVLSQSSGRMSPARSECSALSAPRCSTRKSLSRPGGSHRDGARGVLGRLQKDQMGVPEGSEMEPPCDPAVPALGVYPEETEAASRRELRTPRLSQLYS